MWHPEIERSNSIAHSWRLPSGCLSLQYCWDSGIWGEGMEKTVLEGKNPTLSAKGKSSYKERSIPQSTKNFLKGKSQHLARLLQKYLSSWQNTFTSHRRTSEMTPRESVGGNPGKEATRIKERSLSLHQMPCFYIILSLLRGVLSFPQRYPVTPLQQHSRDVWLSTSACHTSQPQILIPHAFPCLFQSW